MWQTSTVYPPKLYLKTSTLVLCNYPKVEIAFYHLMRVNESFFQAYVTQDLFIKFRKPENSPKFTAIHFHKNKKKNKSIFHFGIQAIQTSKKTIKGWDLNIQCPSEQLQINLRSQTLCSQISHLQTIIQMRTRNNKSASEFKAKSKQLTSKDTAAEEKSSIDGGGGGSEVTE